MSHENQASKRARKETRMPSIPFHWIKFTRSLSTDDGEMTINPDDERVIDTVVVARTKEVGRRTWRWDGGFGWGVVKFSFGASKKRRLSPSRQGVVSTGGRSRWGRLNNPPLSREVEPSRRKGEALFFVLAQRKTPPQLLFHSTFDS